MRTRTAETKGYIMNFIEYAWKNGFSVSKPGAIVATRGRVELFLYTNESSFGMVRVFDKGVQVAEIKNFNWLSVSTEGRPARLYYTCPDDSRTLAYFNRPTDANIRPVGIHSIEDGLYGWLINAKLSLQNS